MSDESNIDSNIDLKKRARRRLVGAAALALLAVIVLPIVMDSEPKPSGQEIQIRIPSQDSDSLVTRVIPSRSTATPTPSLREANPQAEDDVLVSKPVETPIEKLAMPPTVAQVVAPKPKADPIVQVETAKKVDVAHAEAVLEGKDSALWIVQLGAYQNTANVKQLTTKLKAIGVSTYLEKLDSPQGPRTRVRAGPFKSREEADKARLRIKKLGVDGSVVNK